MFSKIQFVRFSMDSNEFRWHPSVFQMDFHISLVLGYKEHCACHKINFTPPICNAIVYFSGWKLFSDGVSSLKVILEERTTAQQQDEREKKIGQDGKRNCYCRISNFGHQISRKNCYNQWQAPREKKY